MAAAQAPGLPPGDIPKYVRPLVIPPAMPPTPSSAALDYYEIAVRQFQQEILPPSLPQTTVWGYGSINHSGTFNYPAFTIEATVNRPVRVKWINQLVNPDGSFLSHLLPIDPTLHWANPPGGLRGRDSRPTFSSTPGPYTGPVPIVAHLHGGEFTPTWADGYPEAWFLPAANNIPAGYARHGSFYGIFRLISPLRGDWTPDSAVFQYPNDQRATTLWYHDHTLGMTRLNVYAGPAGFYLLRGGPDDQVRTANGATAQLPTGPYEVALAIQDRSFNADGSLFYPDSRAFAGDYSGPYIPASGIPPIWNPEFFANTIVVNGRTWPFLDVEQRRYRFRFLNGCTSRFLVLKHDNDLPFWQIGSEGGFLPAPAQLPELLLAPAQRADVIIDFTTVPVGSVITLQNLGPDGPFPGAGQADPTTTGQVLQFHVKAATGPDTSTPPNQLVLPFTPYGPAVTTRQVSLNEATEAGVPRAVLLGTVNPDGSAHPLMWDDPITERPPVGATETWELYNFTADAHPIHVHEVMFEVTNRQPFGGAARDPDPGERGFKDTVIAYPGQITRIKPKFRRAGLFVWHCHIVEHEDNEMMRPYFVWPRLLTRDLATPEAVRETAAAVILALLVFGRNRLPDLGAHWRAFNDSLGGPNQRDESSAESPEPPR